MNYVKESIERVTALESCDGRYRVNVRGCEPGDDRWKQCEKQVKEYEESLCAQAYYRLTKERKVLREAIWSDAGYASTERDVPGWDALHRFLRLAYDMLDDGREESNIYVFRPETEDDVTDMRYLGDMTEDGYEFSTNERSEESYSVGGQNLRIGRVYVLRTRWGELGKGGGDTQLECYDAEKFISCAKELMEGMAGYLDGKYDKKEADNGTDKQ